jgi:hypothetical protein
MDKELEAELELVILFYSAAVHDDLAVVEVGLGLGADEACT